MSASGSSSLTLLLLFIAGATEKEAASNEESYVLSVRTMAADLLPFLFLDAGGDGSPSILV